MEARSASTWYSDAKVRSALPCAGVETSVGEVAGYRGLLRLVSATREAHNFGRDFSQGGQMRTAILTFVLLLAFGLPLQAQPANGHMFFAPVGITCCGQTGITLQVGQVAKRG
jgi:hypothetical protein